MYRDVNGALRYLTTDPDIMFPRVSPTGRVAWKTHSPGTVGGVPEAAHIMTVGNWPVAWGPDDSLYIQVDDSGWLTVWHPSGLWRFAEVPEWDRVPAEYRSEGIHHIAADGTPIMGGGQTIIVNGVQLWNAMQDGENWTGLSNGGGPSGCVALVTPTESLMWVAPTDIPFPPRISGQAVAISAPFDTPDPDAVPWVPFALPVQPLPEIVIGPQRGCDIDDMSGQGYGNASGVGGPSPTHRICEDARFIKPEHEPYVITLVHGPFEGSLLEVTIPMAQRLKKPVILSYDGHAEDDLQPHRKALEAAGLTIWEGRTTYPSPPDEAPEAMYTRLALTLMADSRPSTLIAPGYRVHGRSEFDIARFNEETNRLKEQFAHVKQIGIFGMDRPPIVQWCRDYWRAVTTHTPIPFVPPAALPVTPTVTGISPQPVLGTMDVDLAGTALDQVDTVLLSAGTFTIRGKTPTVIVGRATFTQTGLTQLVAYAQGKPAPNFFFSVKGPTPPPRPPHWWPWGHR